MKYSTVLHENYVIIHLQEDKLNSVIAPELKSAFIMFNTQGQNNIILDLTEVQFADSSGLSALLRANSICTGSGGLFVVFGISEHVRKLIDITHLDRVFNILPTQQEAIEAVFMHEIEAGIDDDDDDDDL
jgi:anti-sigma B factor antagonist